MNSYRSEETRIIPTDDIVRAAKKRRVHKKWILVATFENKEEAKEALSVEKCWSYHYENKSDAGLRVNYRCNMVKFRGDQCEAGRCLLYDSRNSTVHLYRSDSDHTHTDNLNAVNKMSSNVEEAIREMYVTDPMVKPSTIRFNLDRKNLIIPSASQLANFMRGLRAENFGADKISFPVLEKWLRDCSVIPIEKNDPFVVDHEILINEQRPNESVFRFFVSSKQLLESAIGVKKLHTDATYKLIWQGFPVFLVGTSDMHRHFHMFGIGVCTNEANADFEFIFNALNKGVETVYHIPVDPDFLICDAAHAIHIAFAKVYGADKLIIMCWAHMRRAVAKKVLTFIHNKKLQNEVMYDIDNLQATKTTEDFDRAANLFTEKWMTHSEDFVRYFTNEWLEQNRFWYEGAAFNVPSTNNSQEATHKVIKDKHTIRNRFDLGRFREALYLMITKYSTEYSNGTREIYHSPLIELNIWTEAYNWAKMNVPIKVTRFRNRIEHEITIDQNQNMEIDENLMWHSFDNFRKMYFCKCKTTFPTPFNRLTWEKGQCDCTDYFKLNICKHVVGIALRMKYVEAPLEAKNIPIGEKRKRGRPALARGAFVFQ